MDGRSIGAHPPSKNAQTWEFSDCISQKHDILGDEQNRIRLEPQRSNSRHGGNEISAKPF